jgi:hypothetical protein
VELKYQAIVMWPMWQNNSENENQKNNGPNQSQQNLRCHISVGGFSKRVVLFGLLALGWLTQELSLCLSELLIVQASVLVELAQSL